jgi:hypothetical protein
MEQFQRADHNGEGGLFGGESNAGDPNRAMEAKLDGPARARSLTVSHNLAHNIFIDSTQAEPSGRRLSVVMQSKGGPIISIPVFSQSKPLIADGPRLTTLTFHHASASRARARLNNKTLYYLTCDVTKLFLFSPAKVSSLHARMSNSRLLVSTSPRHQ